MSSPVPISPARQALAANVRRLRKAAGLSQDELGDRAGYYGKLVWKIENGTGNPTLNTLASVAAVLGVSLSALCRPASE